MKKILILINAFVLLLATTSCEDWLDVNTDPNNASEATVDLVLPAAQASITTVVSGDLFNLGGFLAQYWDQNPTANQYNTISTYDFTTVIGDEYWRELYSGALNDLQYVIDQTEENEDWGNYLVAKSLRAYTFQLLVDLFDNVPYTEALEGTDFVNPTFDNGSDVYEAILDELDEALAKDLSKASVVTTDMFFGGNLNQWVAFAKTVKLKILLRMAYTDNPHTSELTSLLAEGGFLAQSAGLTAYSAGAQNKRNPWYETNVSRLSGDGKYSINHVGCYNFITYLQTNGDPRLNSLFYPSENSGTHEGNYFGSSKIASERRFDLQEDFSTVRMFGDHPSYIILASESFLLQAEAYARTGDFTNAKIMYDAAVAASFETHGLSDNPASYTGAGGVYEFTATTEQDAIEQIGMQKWICLAHYNNIEAWIEQSRTGYPEISTVLANDPSYTPGEWTSPVDNLLGANRFPHRLYYPSTEVTSNSNTPTQITDMAVKVWWDLND
ncbi:MAG: SusD/RagB family nutrient-binding outer membrane lipoprotein [Bacteroidetes bacterium]|nr:SusD/RagB family nutrient-binding outer membrane lipoprotein [Bacteroidota bacterium]